VYRTRNEVLAAWALPLILSLSSILLPDQITGACPAATLPVYRVWDNRADTDHRYIISRATRDQMVAVGWLAEGYGNDAVILCAPERAATVNGDPPRWSLVFPT
jgi:hypothetical protein